MENTNNIIRDVENVLAQLIEEGSSEKLINEYQTALFILKNPNIKSSKKLNHVIQDLQLTIEFDESKIKTYKEAIEILKNASK